MRDSDVLDESRLRYDGWRVAAACAIAVMCASAPYQVFAVFLKPLTEAFSWSRESVSAAYGGMTLLAALAATPVGGVLDSVGARRVVLPALVVTGVCVTSLAALTSSLWHLYPAFGILGLATIGASPVANSRAVFSWFDRYRGRALALMLAGPAIGGIVLPAALQTIIDRFGWRLAWVAFGGVILCVGFPIAFAFLRERPVVAPSQSSVTAGVSLRDALTSRALWTLMAVVFGSMLATSGATVHMSALLTDRGLSTAQAAATISVMGAASLAGRLLTGWLLDRYTAVRVSVVLLVIASAGTMLLANTHTLLMAVAAAMLIGFGSGGETDVTPYLLSRYFGLRSLSTLYGLNWTAWGLAAVAGPVLLGRAFDATGSYDAALIQLAIVTLLTAVLMLSLSPPYSKRRQTSPTPATSGRSSSSRT